MTPFEYEIQMEAARLRELDRKHAIHENAWAYLSSKQTDSSGKNLKFDSFEKFFGNDYKKAVNEIKQEYNPEAVQEIVEDIEDYNFELLEKLERGANG